VCRAVTGSTDAVVDALWEGTPEPPLLVAYASHHSRCSRIRLRVPPRDGSTAAAHPRANALAGEWSCGWRHLFGALPAHHRCALHLTLCYLAVGINENEWLGFLRCSREAILFSRDTHSAV
jgi:hypothetical protein